MPGVAERAAQLRAELQAELAPTQRRPAPVPVLYLIWREPWMTVARDTYISRLLARVGWQTLPAQEGGEHGAARYPTLQDDEPWLAGVREVLLSSEPYAFTAAHVARRRPCARKRACGWSMASCCAGTAPRTACRPALPARTAQPP